MATEIQARVCACGNPLLGKSKRFCSDICRWRASPGGQSWLARHPEVVPVAAAPYVPRFKPRKLTRAEKGAILARDKETCVYCGRPGRVVDHIVPVRHDGGDEPDNLACACRQCNTILRDMLFPSFAEKRAWIRNYHNTLARHFGEPPLPE